MSDLLRITERYRLDKLMHASDTASVFRATDLRSGDTLALKLIRGDIDASRQDVRSQFESAARALGQCRHTSISRLLDHGFTAAGSAFLVTEYLQGAGFEVFTGSPVGRVLPLLLPVLDGLEELGRHQLAHRNLRADNLLLVPHGDEERLVMLGWGQAVAGAGEEGRRADLRDFAEVTCAAIGAEIQREPELAVTLPPAAAGDPIADAPELAMLLALLLQPGTSAPASLYAELRRAFRQALVGQPEAAGDGSQGAGAGGARRADETAHIAEAPDVIDLDQTRAVAADVTIAVPRDRLLGAMDRWSAAGAAGGGAAGAAGGRSEAGAPAAIGPDRSPARPELRLVAPAAPKAPAPAAPPPAPAAPAAVRGDTLPAFRPEELAAAAPEPASGTAAIEPRLGSAPPEPHSTAAPEPGDSQAGGVREVRSQAGPAGRRRVTAAAGIVLIGVAALVVLAALAFMRQPGNSRRPATTGKERGGTAPNVPPGPTARVASIAGGSLGTLPPGRLGLQAPPSAATPPGAPAPRDPRLQAAEGLLAAGDAAGARREMAQIPAARLTAFGPDERAGYDRLAAALAADRRRQISADLGAALRRGDIRRINAALTAAKWEPDLPAAVRRDLDRARQAVDLDARLGRTDLGQAPQEALRSATDLLALLPRYSRAAELREQAAKVIENQADTALSAGDGERAASLLGGLRQAWPDRPGLQDRFERIEAQRRMDAQMEGALAAAGRAEAAGQPLQGLELLAGANPGGRYRERFRRQRERLEELLARLDAAPPTIVLGASFKLEYDKGAQIAVPLRITDDLAVKSAECWVRPEGAAAFQAVPVRHLAGAEYEVDIPPEVHQNRTVEIYAAASDNSGHRSLLGSRDQPLKLKRRTWIEKIFGGKEGGHPGGGAGSR
jgi:hypothetical protein